MKVLVTGSSGMLGKDIIDAFSKRDNIVLHGIDLVDKSDGKDNIHHKIDLTDQKELEACLEMIDPDLIIHTAAIVNLNTCEENMDLATKLHIDSSRTLALHKVKIVYISTDSIFNGETGFYTEKSVPDPLNNYARTKLLGEYAIRANNPEHIIIRTNIYGFNIPLKGSLCEWAIKSFENNENINGFHDVVFNAIYTKQLADIVIKLVTTDFTGTINIASEDCISKYDFVKYLASKFNMPDERVGSVSVDDFSFTIARPLNTTLNTDKAKKLFSIPSIYNGLDQLYMDYTKKNESI